MRRILAFAVIALGFTAHCGQPRTDADTAADSTTLEANADASRFDDRSDDARSALDASDAAVALDSGFDGGDGAIASDARGDIANDAGTTAAVPFVYVGTGNGDISVFGLNMVSGALTAMGRVAAGAYPSFLAADPSARYLYAALESSNQVAAFAIDTRTGGLTLLNRVGSGGAGPAYVSLDGTGHNVFAANYGGGSVAVFRVQPDGSLGAMLDRQTPGTNPHSIVADAANRFVFVPNKGSNTISQFAFNEATGVLTPNAVPRVMTMAGAGPRHITFHPSGRHAYVMNELDSTVVTYRYDAAAGTLTPIQRITSLPAGFDPARNTGADIHVAPSGRFVYASNRGHDSIVIYSVDATTGMLALVGHQNSGGMTPRNFAIDPTGALLLAANQASNNVVVFRIHPSAGTLAPLGTTMLTSATYWVGVVVQPGR
jgi:6-phosphogluconolactonase